MSINNLARFHDVLASEIALGNEFLYKNSVDDDGKIDDELATQAIRGLTKIRPVFESINLETPQASLIVLAGGDVGFLLNSLESIAYHRTKACLEVVVVPFYGEIKGADRLNAIPWLRVVTGHESLIRVLRNCSSRSNAAIFLTQYERLGLGVVDELIRALDTHLDIGCAGAKILDKDGLILEAGSVCFSDVGQAPRGRGLDSDLAEFCNSTKVNVFSGAFAITFKTLLGLEHTAASWRCDFQDFFELFHEIQLQGKSNWVIPLATTIGYGNKFILSQDQLSRASRVLNGHVQLKNKYPDVYKFPCKSGKFLGDESRGEILYFDFMVPDVEADAGSVTCVNILKSLRDQGWGITFVPTSLCDLDIRTTRLLSRLGVKVLYRYHLGSLVENLLLVCPKGFDLIIGVRVVVMAPLLSFIKEKFPHCPFVFFDCDLYYLREQREAEVLGSLRLLFNSYATKKEELKCFEQADCNIVHTDVEQSVIEAELDISNIVSLPYSVNSRNSDESFAERKNIMFLGGYEHVPNVDAAKYFVAEIWPILKTKLPTGTRLLLVGSKPECGVADLASDDIVVTGQVPNLSKYFDSSRVFIAPLRYGAGLKGKVLTAMANGVPCVLTPIASEGFPMENGVHFLGANDPETFATEVLRLFNDEALFYRVQKAAYKLVEKIAGRAAFDKKIENAIAIAQKNWIKKISHKDET